MTVVFKARLSPVFFEMIERGYRSEKGENRPPSLESYMRRRSVVLAEQRIQGYLRAAGGGFKMFYTTPAKVTETTVLDMDEPDSFIRFEDVEPTEHETKLVEIGFPDKYFEKFLVPTAMYENASNRWINKLNEDQEMQKNELFPSIGQWFKRNCFVPAFNGVDSKDRLEEIEDFDKELKKGEHKKADVIIGS